jgi:outer membrane protein assembly factor BamB
LKTAWFFDCNPPEYKSFGGLDWASHYSLGDKRLKKSLNKTNDGSFVGMSEIIATPVPYKDRVYVAIGRDPEHGRGRGALWCIDATKTGDVTGKARIWCYQGLDRTMATVSISNGLLYIPDVAGRLHCLDAETGDVVWVHETKAGAWSSTLVADGKIYLPTVKHLWVLAAGKEKKVLSQINLGAAMWASPVVADGTLYIASRNYLWAVHE